MPFIYWNATHDWATLRLNFWLRHCDTANLSIFGTLEYVQEQLVNTSVFLAIPLIGVLFVRTSRLPQAWRDSFQLLRAHALSVLGVFLIVGTLSQTHPDWTVLAYPSASIAMAALYTANPRNWLVRRANLLIGLSVVTLVLATCVALVALFPIVEGFQIARLVGSSSKYAAAAEERLRGWTHVHTALATRLPGEWTNPDTLVFTDGFRFGSMLSFHRGGRPVVNLAPFRHEHDKVGDGQLYYQSWERLRGTDGLFVSKDESPIRQPELFRKITELEPLEIKYGTSRTKRYRIYRVDGFQPDVCD